MNIIGYYLLIFLLVSSIAHAREVKDYDRIWNKIKNSAFVRVFQIRI